MSDWTLDGLFEFVARLWPGTRMTKDQIEVAVWDPWACRIHRDTLKAALRTVRAADANATRPNWDHVRTAAYKLFKSDKPETEPWVLMARHIREGLPRDHHLKTADDERVYSEFLQVWAVARRLDANQLAWLRSHMAPNVYAEFLARTITNAGRNSLSCYYRQVERCDGRTCGDCEEEDCTIRVRVMQGKES